MYIANSSPSAVDAKVGPGTNGGGPDGWRRIGPNEAINLDLPPNTLWQIECRVAGSQLVSTLQAASNAAVELTIVGARVRAEVGDHQPIQV